MMLTGPAAAMTAPTAAVKTRVNELIQNPRRYFTELDRPKLESFNEKILKVLQAQPLGPLPCGCVRDFCIHLQESFSRSAPAQRLEANMLRTNTLLRADEWALLDRRVAQISANVMYEIASLRALGLTTSLGGIGVIMSQYDSVDSINIVEEMSNEEAYFLYPLSGMCVPIISKSFRIDARALADPRWSRRSLDIADIDTATRNVVDTLEGIFYKSIDEALQSISPEERDSRRDIRSHLYVTSHFSSPPFLQRLALNPAMPIFGCSPTTQSPSLTGMRSRSVYRC